MGTEEYDKGSVKASDGAIIGYLRQDFDYDSHTTVSYTHLDVYKRQGKRS